MIFFKLLNYDTKYGIIRRWYVFLITIIFAFAQCRSCHGIIESLQTSNMMRDNGTVMDYILYSFQGMCVYIFSPRNLFTIPLYWFIFQVGISYIIAYYTENDLRHYGRNILMACKSRYGWWFSKVAVCICSVLIYYAITVGWITLMALSCGATLSLQVSNDFVLSAFSYTLLYMNSSDVVWISLLLPFLTTLSVCLIQVASSLVISPVISFAAVCSMYVLSAYYTSPWLIGNYTMWQRSSYYIEGGISPDSGLFLSVMII